MGKIKKQQPGQTTVRNRKEHYVCRNYSAGVADSDVDRCNSRLATQQELGLCSERRTRFDRSHFADPAFDGQNLNPWGEHPMVPAHFHGLLLRHEEENCFCQT